MFDFYKVAIACPSIKLFDPEYNTNEIYKLILEAEEKKARIIIFPELCLTGSTCLDLFKQKNLISDVKKNFDTLRENLSDKNIMYVIGMPLEIKNNLFNCAVVCYGKNILGVVPKINLSDTDKRYFSAGKKNFATQINNSEWDSFFFGDLIFEMNDRFLIKANFDLDFCNFADINLNLASKPIYLDENFDELIIKSACIKNNNACAYINSGYGESTTNFVFNGTGFIFEQEKKLTQTKKYLLESQMVCEDIDFDKINFKKQKREFIFEPNYFIKITLPESDETDITRKFDKNPFLKFAEQKNFLREILLIQQNAIITRFKKSESKKIIIGISGGIDSTLSLINAIFAFDRLKISHKNILGVNMPGFGTSDITFDNAKFLSESFDITYKIIPIKDICEKHFKDIDHDIKNLNVTFENAQVRERTQILFDLANDLDGIVLGTGDLSEIATGFTTYNGDNISHYNPNANLPKSLIRELVKFIIEEKYFSDKTNACLKKILETPISPELLPNEKNKSISQQTEKIVGPYELIDFFIFYLLKHGFKKQKIVFMAERAFENYSREKIEFYFDDFYRRFIKHQFKRSCSNDGPQIFSFGLSPRNSFLMPSDI